MSEQKTASLAIADDPNAMAKNLNDLGWVNLDRNLPEFVAKRQYLEAHNGIAGLEVVSPDAVDDAVRIFYRDRFVVVRDALSPRQLAYLREGCDRVIHEIMAIDRHRVGNRGSHRYSFGGASLTGHMMHNPEWTMLLDLPTITPILTAIFGSADYIARGGGGDFCLPGARTRVCTATWVTAANIAIPRQARLCLRLALSKTPGDA